MIEQSAHVVALEGEFAWVETERQSSCSSCATKGCGTGALSKVLGARRQRLRVANPVGAKTGDTVVLGIREEALLQGSLMVYILPLILMLAGGLLGEMLAPQWLLPAEGMSLFFGGLGLLLGFILLRRFNRRAEQDPRFNAVILRKETPLGTVKPISMNL
ncbi:MAG: SoxR reducing system RseC family protein [Pseudomonadota bacterium]